MEENLYNNENSRIPAGLKLLSQLSIAIGIITVSTTLILTVFWSTFGAYNHQGCAVLVRYQIWQYYLRHFLIAVIGVLMFAGGLWCMERKRHGWHTASYCCFVISITIGKSLITTIKYNGFDLCLIILTFLFLFSMTGYIYLFTEQPQTFLQIKKQNAGKLSYFNS